MKLFLLTGTLAYFSLSVSTGSTPSITDKFEALKNEVAHVQALTRMSETLKIILAPSNMLGISPIAWSRLYSYSAQGTTYGIYIRESFLAYATSHHIAHIARHELCHILNGDLTHYSKLINSDEDVLRMESKTERCVARLVGDVQYRQYIKAYEDWQPPDDVMAIAKRRILITMQSP